MDNKNLRLSILKIMEKNSRFSTADLSAMLGKDEEVIKNEIKKLEDERVICGYPTFIDWDKIDESEKVTALIEVKVSPKRDVGFEFIAKRIYRFEEVSYVYLMSADYDLMVIVEGRSMKEVANFVHSKLSPLESVISTETHFVLKKYKEHGLSYVEEEKDERELITP